MLTQNKVEKIKQGTSDLNIRIAVDGLIETLESAVEVFKRLRASDTLGREGREFLAKYERGD